MMRVELVWVLGCASVLAGCAGMQAGPVKDDGREIPKALVENVRASINGVPLALQSQALTSPLVSGDCAQASSPSLVLHSHAVVLDETLRLAAQRIFPNFDEKLRVAYKVEPWAPAGLEVGDVIVAVNGWQGSPYDMIVEYGTQTFRKENTVRVTRADGKEFTVANFKHCRGHFFPGSATSPNFERLTWDISFVRHEVFRLEAEAGLTDDEKAWMAAWFQGLNYTTGAGLKVFDRVGTFLQGAVISPLVVGPVAALVGIAAVAATQPRAGEANDASAAMMSVAPRVPRSGISSVAEGGFVESDAWAVQAMRKLGRDPRAGLSLHGKLMARGYVYNPFALTQERHDAMLKLLEPEMKAATPAKPGG